MPTPKEIAAALTVSRDVQRLYRRFQNAAFNEQILIIMAAHAVSVLAVIDDPRAPPPTREMKACVGPLKNLLQTLGKFAREHYKDQPELPQEFRH